MRTDLCNFSGYKIYPGHGIRCVRADGKLLIFINKKSESLFESKKNPRKISWTVLYRKLHKKGQKEEVQKKRSKRNVKFQRAIDGNTLQSIMEKRNQSTDVRKSQRESAIKIAKEQIKEKRDKKKNSQQEAQAKAFSKTIKHQTQSKMKQPRMANIRMG
ncbi:hypothetical protein HZS_7571, partial [Henneguya salminicola]